MLHCTEITDYTPDKIHNFHSVVNETFNPKPMFTVLCGAPLYKESSEADYGR